MSYIIGIFNEILTKYYIRLQKVEDNYFLKGDLIEDVIKKNGNDRTEAIVLVNEYTALINARLLINFIRLCIDYDNLPEKNEIIHYNKINFLLTFIMKVKAINTLDKELYMSYTNNSGLSKIFEDLVADLSAMNYNFNEDYNNNNKNSSVEEQIESHHIISYSLILMQMIIMVRIIMVNSTFFGNKSKFFNISGELLNWLDSSNKELRMFTN